MRLHHVEARVCGAVGIVLAAMGCHAPAPTEVPPTDPQPTDPIPSPRPSTPEDEPEYFPSGPGREPADTSARDAGAPTAEGQPVAFCAAYKERVAVHPEKKTREQQSDYERPPAEAAYWAPASKTIWCTLVREHTRVAMKRVYAPTCCQQGGHSPRPCPPAQTVTIRGDKFLVESAELRADGTVVTSTLTWVTRDPDPPQRHNCGRRPEGFSTAEDRGDASLGAELAAMAVLEAASVPAFERLARELVHLGAPRELVLRARAAMADEVRHARVVSGLALDHGRRPRPVEVPHLPCRDALEVAMENAAEGCVREAFGALVATFQANRASPTMQRAFDRIARDERRHTALAEDVHTWILSRLTSEERDAVSRHRERALVDLRANLAESPQCGALGLPSPSEARALYEAYFDTAA